MIQFWYRISGIWITWLNKMGRRVGIKNFEEMYVE